ncbi:MAG: leucyl/phenylalanyl-tRNA--protein transferase [Pseudomonadota bacterium]
MPVFRLSQDLVFPPARLARNDGLLCVGGDLSPERLLLAYQNGIFPWFSENDPILWWSPDPRLVLFPEKIHISKSLYKTIKKKRFDIRIDTAFEQIIHTCASLRKKENNGTWLVDEMVAAYIALHKKGVAHSIETWQDNSLVGGLYGISLGRSFFGESMFSLIKDASKTALVFLATHLKEHEFDLIDCQVTSNHLLSMGAVEITRLCFLEIIQLSVKKKPILDPWDQDQSITIM